MTELQAAELIELTELLIAAVRVGSGLLCFLIGVELWQCLARYWSGV